LRTANITVTFIGFENVSHVGGTPRQVPHSSLLCLPELGRCMFVVCATLAVFIRNFRRPCQGSSCHSLSHPGHTCCCAP
jgi:hypothetical protein